MDAGAWFAAAAGLIGWLVVVTAGLCAFLGVLLASAGRMPRWAGILTGALGGPLGVAVLALVALARRGTGAAPSVVVVPPGDVDPAAVTPAAVGAATGSAARAFRLRPLEAVLLTAAGAALIVALFLDSVRLSTVGVTVLALPLAGTGFDAAALLTLVPLAGVVLLLGWGYRRWAAALAATVAACWLAALGAVVAVWLPLRAALAQATTAGGTVGDALERIGLTVDGVGVSLPEGGVFSLLGLSGRRFELAGVDLGAVIPHLTLGLGSGLLTLIGAAAILAAVAFLARRPVRLPG